MRINFTGSRLRCCSSQKYTSESGDSQIHKTIHRHPYRDADEENRQGTPRQDSPRSPRIRHPSSMVGLATA